MNLIEIVVDILNDMDSDIVNSIDDTFESQQVAQIVKSTFYSMMSNRNWPHLKRLVSLNSSGTTSRPTHMSVDSEVKEMVSIAYNVVKDGETKRRYKEIRWKEPDDFLRYTNTRDSDQSNVDIILDTTGVELLIKNDKAPEYYTSFDDENIVFDSYDIAVDSTLQSSKVQAQAYVSPSWTHTDTFIPDLPEEAFSALLEEAKSRCMMRLRQMVDQKAEQESQRQQRWLSRKAWKVKGGIKYPNYGRRGAKTFSDVTFKQSREV